LFVGLAFYRGRWRQAVLIMMATMLVDLDHLTATPIYDPERCSIGFHPLHGAFPIAIYGALFVLPLVASRKADIPGIRPAARVFHLIGLGLLIHMALDWIDCLL
jgi:hypothetical protein